MGYDDYEDYRILAAKERIADELRRELRKLRLQYNTRRIAGSDTTEILNAIEEIYADLDDFSIIE